MPIPDRKLSTRERIYQFMRNRLQSGRPPSVREVQQAFSFRAVQTAQEHLNRLVAEGRLIKRPGQARGYSLPESEGPPPRLVPLLGQVQAGGPALALEHIEGYLPIGQPGGVGDLFALRVAGESMTGAGILPGDLVIVRSQPTAESGAIVVALVDGEATVKTLRLRGGRVELHPDNPEFVPIIPSPETFQILGKVIEVRRMLEGGLS